MLAKVSARLAERTEELAELITEEMGAALAITKAAQITSPIAILDYYANLAHDYAFEEIRDGLTVEEVLVTKEPVGVVGAIAPWNVPLFISLAKLGCPRCSPAAPSSTSRRPRPRSTPTGWRRSSPRPACPRACSPWCRRAAR